MKILKKTRKKQLFQHFFFKKTPKSRLLQNLNAILEGKGLQDGREWPPRCLGVFGQKKTKKYLSSSSSYDEKKNPTFLRTETYSSFLAHTFAIFKSRYLHDQTDSWPKVTTIRTGILLRFFFGQKNFRRGASPAKNLVPKFVDIHKFSTIFKNFPAQENSKIRYGPRRDPRLPGLGCGPLPARPGSSPPPLPFFFPFVITRLPPLSPFPIGPGSLSALDGWPNLARSMENWVSATSPWRYRISFGRKHKTPRYEEPICAKTYRWTYYNTSSRENRGLGENPADFCPDKPVISVKSGSTKRWFSDKKLRF